MVVTSAENLPRHRFGTDGTKLVVHDSFVVLTAHFCVLLLRLLLRDEMSLLQQAEVDYGKL